MADPGKDFEKYMKEIEKKAASARVPPPSFGFDPIEDWKAGVKSLAGDARAIYKRIVKDEKPSPM